jgi:hypothetical protein
MVFLSLVDVMSFIPEPDHGPGKVFVIANGA